MTKELQPAIHRKWIKEGKMTKEESQQIVREWKLINLIEETTGETIEDMGIEEEVEDSLTEAEKLGAYQDDNGEWVV